MEMTIKQLADELGVSKTTVNRAVRKLGWKDELCKVGNRYIFSETQILQLKKKILESYGEEVQQSQQSQQSYTILEKQIFVLNQQLNIKDNQIKLLQEQLIAQSRQLQLLQEQLTAKDNQIGQITVAMENLTTALTAAQALHAGTIQKQLTEHSESIEQSSEPEQPKQKQSLLSKLFGRKES